jgi:radical SAM superfamily enzyme YgiQ (UPF0313 family)
MPQKIALIDLEPRFPTTSSQHAMIRHGLLAVATAASRAGHEVSVFVESLNGVRLPELLQFDVVGASVTGSNLSRVKEIFAQIRFLRPDIFLIAGGPHATLIPTDVAPFVDIVVRDEGETTFVEILAALETPDKLQEIEGVSRMQGPNVVHQPRREFLRNGIIDEDVELIRGFSPKSRLRQLLSGRAYTAYTASSRGCPFPCSFCYENMIGGTGFRPNSAGELVNDIRRKISFFGTKRFWFADSNFTTNPRHCIDLLHALVDADLGCEFSALCRVDVGRQPEMLNLMKQAGFTSLVLGMEATDDSLLEDLIKKQTVDDILLAIQRIHEHKMCVNGLFMVGFDGDDADTPHRIASFCDEHGVDAFNLYCLSEYPSLPGRTLPRWRICESDLDYYTGHFVTTFPLLVPPSILERSTFDAYLSFYSLARAAASFVRRDFNALSFQLPLYFQVRRLERLSRLHQQRLKQIEEPYYDSHGRLRQDLLRQNPIVRDPLPVDMLAGWADPDTAFAAH